MNNKELLLGCSEEPHMVITVGCWSYAKFSYYGYDKANGYGAVSRLPWYSIEGQYVTNFFTSYMKLEGGDGTELWFQDTGYGFPDICAYTKYGVIGRSTKAPSNHIITTGELLIPEEKGIEVAVYFDPPPDGYLDPKTLESIEV